MVIRNTKQLNQGDEVFIIWTSKLNFIKIDGVFLSYIDGKIIDKTALFSTKHGNITGEECFWVLKKRIKKESDILKYQKKIIPLQMVSSIVSYDFGISVLDKIKCKELNKMAQEKISNKEKLKQFITRYGFNPFDDSWMENYLTNNEIEKQWFKFTRDRDFLYPEQKIVDFFNNENNTNITVEEAKKMTIRKMRYILGSTNIRQQGNPIVEEWKKKAIGYEKKFSDRDKRMDEWVKSKNGILPWVTTKEPLEFWKGTYFLKCLEKIPHVFTSPDCDFIKSGVALEVKKYDPIDKWIHLDFTPDIKEKLLGTKTDIETDYAIIVVPNNIKSCLENINEL
jgi:hypothetical protein